MIQIEGTLPSEVTIQQLESLLVAAAKRSKHPSKDLSIGLILVDEARMRDFCKKYLGEDKVTDVLSFEGEEDQTDLGDIVICLPVAKVQAKEHNQSFAEEFLLLYLHGVLHLLGHDHAGEKDRIEMEELQQSILHSLGQKGREYL